MRKLLTIGVVLFLSACTSVPQTPNQINDPLESVNRVTFDVNNFLDDILFRPVAVAYHDNVPDGVRDGVSNVLSNMSEPVNFANNVLQGEFTKAGITTERFFVNTTVGMGGMFDVATEWHTPKQNADFGQTLYTWGLGSGPYLVLPILGPSDMRDTVGLGVDAVATPWPYLANMGGEDTYYEFLASDMVMTGITKREQNIKTIDALKNGSVDFYAQVRSVYQQHRNKELGITQKTPKYDYDDYE